MKTLAEPHVTYMRYYDAGHAAGRREGLDSGAAVAFGLMGMAQAIRKIDRIWQGRCASCGVLVPLYFDDDPPHDCGLEIGAYLERTPQQRSTSRRGGRDVSEPCVICHEGKTGPEARTPHGICPTCACEKCRGFARYDDRGFLCTGQPFFTSTPCETCEGTGVRTMRTPQPSSDIRTGEEP